MRSGRFLLVGLATACSSAAVSSDPPQPAPGASVPAATTPPAPTRDADPAPRPTAPTTIDGPTTTTTTTAVSAPAERAITIAVTGDILPHSPLWRRAARTAEEQGATGHDFGPMLAGLRPVLDAADLAICHLETPIAPESEPYTTFPRFGVPVGIVDAIAAAGYHRCSTASNHTADRGAAGIDRTVDAFEARGLGQSGMARRPVEIHPDVFDVAGVAVAHLSYTWSYNGLSLPDGEEWRSATIDPERVVRDARVARARGAELVLVSMHWGAEGVHEPTRFQREIADQVTAGGLIDLVIGHHAHVVQPIEQVNDTWVLFGLGNILSNLPTSDEWPAASQDAAVVTVTLTIRHDGRVSAQRPVAHPTWVDRDAGWMVRLVDDELGRDVVSAGRRAVLERSRERTERVLGPFFATG
jgi:poly-gamma-glutamate synthesis protein (capsule biosynthesis protein)